MTKTWRRLPAKARQQLSDERLIILFWQKHLLQKKIAQRLNNIRITSAVASGHLSCMFVYFFGTSTFFWCNACTF
jgi:hypothetical protein